MLRHKSTTISTSKKPTAGSKQLKNAKKRPKALKITKRRILTTPSTPQTSKSSTPLTLSKLTPTPMSKLSVQMLSGPNPQSESAPHTTATRSMAMQIDPLGQQRTYALHNYIPRMTTVAARSTDRRLRVIVAGYMSFFAQHLAGILEQRGFEVVPVSQEGTHYTANIHVHSTAYYQEYGLDDVDFIINCSGLNLWAKDFDLTSAKKIKVETNAAWARLIRKSKAKPYAYVTLSSTAIYPNGTDEIFLDSWKCPGLGSMYTHNDAERLAFDKSAGVTALQSMFRDAEEASRVWIPELDSRTQEQIEEYNKYRQLYDHDDKKSGVHGSSTKHINEQARDASVRNSVITNAQVRVIQARLPFLACQEMQEVRDFRTFLENGSWGPIPGCDKAIVPWMWIDDAADAIVRSLTDTKINGALNVVTAPKTTSKEFMEFIPKINKVPISRSMSHHQLVGLYGEDRAKLFTENKIVVPQKLGAIHFTPMVPSLDLAIKENRSLFEHEINHYNGIENLPRFGYKERR